MDDRRVLVSSINWNEASPSFNREAGVIVDDPGTAAYFAAAFDADWDTGAGGSAAVAGRGIDWFRLGIAALVLVVIAAALLWRKRRV